MYINMYVYTHTHTHQGTHFSLAHLLRCKDKTNHRMLSVPELVANKFPLPSLNK